MASGDLADLFLVDSTHGDARRGGDLERDALRGVDDDPGRCKFWVACTRATDLLVIHLPERDKRYLELAGSYTTVGDASTLKGHMDRLPQRSS